MLNPCGNSPNCVCTRDTRPKFHMDPLPYQGDSETALNTVIQTLQKQTHSKLIERRPGYAHLIAITRLFRFRDDVEFEIDPAQHVMHFRSASRLGHWDLGTNRRRMKRLVRALEQRG